MLGRTVQPGGEDNKRTSAIGRRLAKPCKPERVRPKAKCSIAMRRQSGRQEQQGASGAVPQGNGCELRPAPAE
jgi:hypothetical protein